MKSISAPKKVGVVIPAYGHSRFLRGAVMSALMQKEVDVSVVVVVDGCSLDDTRQTAFLAQEVSERTRLEIIFKTNGGLSSARNVGIRSLLKKSVDYIYLLDADNTLSMRALASAIEDLDKAACDWAYPDINSLGASRPTALTGGVTTKYLLAARNYMEAGSLISRRVFEAGVFFDENFKSGYEDWDFWLHATSREFKGVHSAALGLNYRQRYESMLTDSDRIRSTLVESLRKKYPSIYNDKYLASAELADAPRLLFVNTGTGLVSRNGFDEGLPIEQMFEYVNRMRVPLGVEIAPDYFAFVDVDAIKRGDALSLLKSALIMAEVLLESDCSYVGITLDSRVGGQAGLSVGLTPDNPVVGVVVRKKLLDEVLNDTDEWFFKQLVRPEVGVGKTIKITPAHVVPVTSIFGRDLVRVFGLLRKNRFGLSTYSQNPESHGFYFPLAPETKSAEIRADLPIYPHPFAPKARQGKRTIGFVLPFGSFGGVEKVTLEVARTLSDQGCACHCFIELAQPLVGGFFDPGIFESVTYLTPLTSLEWDSSTSYFGAGNVIASNFLIGHVASVLLTMDEVIFCNSHLAIKSASILKARGVKTAAYVHTFDLTKSGRPVGWPYYVMAYEHKIDKIYTCSPTMSDEMLALGAPRDKVATIINASSLTPKKKKIRLKIDALKLVYLGRIDRQKGVERLAGLVFFMKNCGLKFELKIAGESIMGDFSMPADLIEYAVGRVSGSELVDLLDWGDCLLLPSYWEGLPLSVLEALSRGCVPVCSAVGDIPRLASENGAIVCVDWDDPAEVTNSLKNFSSSRLSALSSLAFDFSKSNTWANNVSAISSIN